MVFSGTLIPTDSEEKAGFFKLCRQEKINDMSKALFFHLFFEDLQLVASWLEAVVSLHTVRVVIDMRVLE